MNPEHVVARRATLVGSSLETEPRYVSVLGAEGWEATLEAYNLSHGHLHALMQAVAEFSTRHGLLSDGMLSITYSEEDDNIASLEGFTVEMMRRMIELVPEWFWDGTEVFLKLPGVPGFQRQDPDTGKIIGDRDMDLRGSA